MYMCVYIFISRERERGRERDEHKSVQCHYGTISE